MIESPSMAATRPILQSIIEVLQGDAEFVRSHGCGLIQKGKNQSISWGPHFNPEP
jgi:hypothetical protein